MPQGPDGVRVVQAVLTAVYGDNRAAMANDTGYDLASISRYVRGVKPPSPTFLDRLARAPGVNPRFVRDGLGQPRLGDLPEPRPEHSIPFAKSLLPGAPHRYPSLLSPESLDLPQSVRTSTSYAVRAQAAFSGDELVTEFLLPNDAIVIETERDAIRNWRRVAPRSLWIFARRAARGWELHAGRKPPEVFVPYFDEREIELPGVKERKTASGTAGFRTVGVAKFLFRNL